MPPSAVRRAGWLQLTRPDFAAAIAGLAGGKTLIRKI
jgi:hypothetical protein